MNANDITNIARAAAKAQIAQDKGLLLGFVDTADATATTILTITPDDQTAGILEVKCVGFDGTNSVVGSKQVSYKKSGTVTLGTPSDTMALEASGAEAFDISASSGDILVKVTGLAGVAYAWSAAYNIINAFKEVALP